MSEQEYKRGIVTYIDILGFRELIEKTKGGNLQTAEVLSLLRTVKEDFAAGGRIALSEEKRLKRIFYATNFSDLTVRTTVTDANLTDLEIADYLNWELMYVGSRQLQLAIRGVLLRGGICIGQIYSDKDYVFGPALVKAYAIESKYAQFPRVAVDWKALHTAERELRPGLWHDRYVRGEDGVFFIDYLFSTFIDYYSFPGGEFPDPWHILIEHKARIEEKIDDIDRYDERTKQKYMWLALYHNHAINRISQRIPEFDAHRLNDAMISRLTF